MTHVLPRPALGLSVTVNGEEGEIAGLDAFKRTYDFRPFSAPAAVLTGLSLDEYKPTVNRTNFEKALEQWDYYYGMSESDLFWEAGKAGEQQLIQMFKELTDVDKLHYRKILAIVVASTAK
jgi:hypothetical protein